MIPKPTAKVSLGLCILTSGKKKPFLADPKYLKHKGFAVCDQTAGGIQLAYLPFGADAPKPAILLRQNIF